MRTFEDIIGDTGADGPVRGARYTNSFLKVNRRGLVSEKQWGLYGEQMIANFVGRTGLTFNIRDIERTENLKGFRAPDTVRIACVSSPFSIKEPGKDGNRGGDDLSIADYRDGCRLCEAFEEGVGDKWIAERLKELDLALSFDPHVVCFGELAYPPADPVKEKDWSSESLQKFAQLRARFEDDVLTRLKDRPYPPFVFLGSYHCLVTLYSVGVTLPWGANLHPTQAVITTEPWEDKRRPIQYPAPVKAPFLYRKRFPARRVGESTRIPATLDFDVFDTPAGKIAILICSDVLDLNQFLHVARHNILPTRERLDLILVPSFNESKKLASMCCELSYAAGCAVVLVNANKNLSSFPDTDLFLCGLSSAELAKVKGLGLDVVPQLHRPKEVEHRTGRKAYITMFELNREGARGFRNELANIWDRNRKGRSESP